MTETLTQPTSELDLRTIAPRERHPLIFSRF
ncbi:MAG: aminotransferase, partial [Burkholderiales bacterium PBB5]